MNKILLVAVALLVTGTTHAQKYMTRTGKITFDATTKKSPEQIKGVNNEVASILDAKSGDFVFQAQVKSFKFERELMEQHFNENYMESDKFPKSDFKGKVTNMNAVDITKDGTYNVTVAGKLTIHGVTKEVTVPGTLSVKGKDISAKAKFSAKLPEYGIKIPGLVADKLAEDAQITVDAILTQK